MRRFMDKRMIMMAAAFALAGCAGEERWQTAEVSWYKWTTNATLDVVSGHRQEQVFVTSLSEVAEVAGRYGWRVAETRDVAYGREMRLEYHGRKDSMLILLPCDVPAKGVK